MSTSVYYGTNTVLLPVYIIQTTLISDITWLVINTAGFLICANKHALNHKHVLKEMESLLDANDTRKYGKQVRKVKVIKLVHSVTNAQKLARTVQQT
jgi:hypothetical protein